MIRIEHVNKVIDKKCILENINLTLPDTGFILIKGDNGAGKSTLLNLIGVLEKPTSGNIFYNNTNLTLLNEEKLTTFREEYISFIFQDPNLFANFTALENINITNKNNLNEVINFLDIKDLLNKKAKVLSGGEQQRIAIARAILKDSPVLLADEPTGALDLEMKTNLFSYLKKISKEKLVIIISHDTNLASFLADIIIEINDGKISNIINKNNILEENHKHIYHNQFKALNFTLKNLYQNKVRLIFSSFIFIITLTLLLLSTSLSSLNYNKIHEDTMNLENDTLFIFNKNNGPFFNDEDVTYLKNTINQDFIIGKLLVFDSTFFINNVYKRPNLYLSIIPINNFAYFDISNLDHIDYGRYPTKDNEIVISSYLADLAISNGFLLNDGFIYKPTNYQALVTENKEIDLGGKPVYIVGIFDLGLEEQYGYLKEIDDYYRLTTRQKAEYYIYGDKVLNNAANVYVTDGFWNYFNDIPNSYIINKKIYTYIKDKQIRDKVFANFPIEDSEFTIATNYSPIIIVLKDIINRFVDIFKVISIILGIFTILLLINYTLNSIFLHQKDIAILKNLGIKEKQINTLFITELLFLTLFSFIISFIIFLVSRLIINNIASNFITFKINILPINIINILAIFLGILLFIFLVSFIIKKKIKKLSPQKIYKTN